MKSQYKCHKYSSHLVIDLSNIAFKVKFYDIEIGCRGFISMDNSNRLYAVCHAIPVFKVKQVDFGHFRKFLSSTAVIAPFAFIQISFSTNLVLSLIYKQNT